MPDDTPASTEKSWYSHLTIDLIASVLNRSIFHPYICWLIPLCLRAVVTRYEAPEFIASCVWASLVTVWAILGVFNRRIAYGLPREVDWDEEVVVITGGANGLGKILAETYGMRGVSVAVLDVQKPEKESEGLAGINFYTCDVGDAAAVEKVKAEIEKDVCRAQYIATPFIRYAMANGKSPSSARRQSSSTTLAS
jgi:hypothetical protein